MTYVLWVFAAGLLALGLRTWLDQRASSPITVLAIAVAGIWTATIQVSIANSLQEGTYRFSLLPLFDVKQARAIGASMPFVPAYALSASGEFLCTTSNVTAHGAFAVHLLHDYAIEARLLCDDASHVWLGGKGPVGNSHWTGISRALADALELPIDTWIGPLGIVPVTNVVHPSVGSPLPSLRQYPPATDASDHRIVNTLEFDTMANEIVLVTDMYFTFGSQPTIEASANGNPVPALARDQVSSAYLCAMCDRSASTRWRLDITSPAMNRIDVVTVAFRKHWVGQGWNMGR